jgi:DNA end-binding protein Ku
VSFGLVNVPVKLMTAQSPKDVRFNQLHDVDSGKINQKRVCSVDGEEVDYAHIVKGYDLGGGRYVIIEPEELRSIDPEASRTIDIEEFVDLADIDPIYYERSYYLVPDDRAAKPYALLAEAMAKTEKVALGRFVLRTKQYLATLRAKDGVLILSTMLYADEVNDIADLEVPSAESTKPSERELAMAEQLVESLSTDFDPAKYHDDYREKILELIDRKADGEVIAEVAQPTASAPVVDLMAALEASLAAARSGKPAKAGSGRDGSGSSAGRDGGSGSSTGRAGKDGKSGRGGKASRDSKAGNKDQDTEEGAGSKQRESA